MLKSLIALRYGLASSILMAAAMHEGDEPELGLIELDGDLSDVEKPPELPAGKYEAEVTEVSVAVSQKGNSFYAIKITVPTEHVPANMAEDFPDGAVLYWNRQLVVDQNSDRRTKFNLRKMIEAFGLPTDVREIDPTQWQGCKVGIVVKSGRFNGEPRAEIGSLFAVDEAPAKTKAAPAKGKRGK